MKDDRYDYSYHSVAPLRAVPVTVCVVRGAVLEFLSFSPPHSRVYRDSGHVFGEAGRIVGSGLSAVECGCVCGQW